ncbi:hypothetical protein JCM11491_003133 [Sporobolomyces phaffii]
MTDAVPEQYAESLNLAIPTPALKKSFRLVCDVEAVRSLGEGLNGDGGQFNWVIFTGGYISSSFGLTARILPGGQDAQHLLSPSHPSSPLACQVSTRYLLETDDGVFIQVQTRGWRTGSKDILERLSAAAREGFDGVVPKPDEYKFRLFIEMETDARNEKYAWLNQAMFVGSGMRSGRQVVYDAYLVE